jgi:aminoglycoside N3'-acetyltransferase
MMNEDLARDVAELGVARDDHIILHSSFKAVCRPRSAPVDLVSALLHTVGPHGTLMATAFTYSYAGRWGIEPFSPMTTPGVDNGAVAEALRTYPRALRSGHPTHSICAVGALSVALTTGKELASPLGRGSSFEEALDRGAKILLIGVGNDRNSSLHHAEVVAGLPYNDIPFRACWGDTARVRTSGGFTEVTLSREFPGCSRGFSRADAYLRDLGLMPEGRIGSARSLLMDGQRVVEAVVARLRSQADWLLCDSMTCEPCTLRRWRLLEHGLIRSARSLFLVQ